MQGHFLTQRNRADIDKKCDNEMKENLYTITAFSAIQTVDQLSEKKQ